MLNSSRCNRDLICLQSTFRQHWSERSTKIIDNPEPVFGEVPELEGVWATGSTVEDCRRELISVIEGWIALRLRMGDSIPSIGNFTINVSTEPMAVV